MTRTVITGDAPRTTKRGVAIAGTAAAALGGVLVCGACAGEPVGERTDVEARDSAGVEIIATHRPESAPVWTIGSTPRLTIGVVDGAEAQQLDRVRNPVRLPDGRIALADAGSGEVRIFDAEGRILVRSGGAGEGPGEFRSMEWLRPYRGDSLAVFDGVLDRVTILASDGTFGRVVRVGGAGGGAAGVAGAVGAAPTAVTDGRAELVRATDVFADGDFLARLSEVSAGPGDTTAVRRDPVPYARFDPEGGRVAAVGAFADDEAFVFATPGSRSVRPRAFGRETFVAVRDDRIHVADNNAFQVVILDAAGRALRIARAAVEPAAVDEATRTRWTHDALADLTSDFLRRLAEDAIRAMPFPDSMPYHGPMVVGDEGTAWLARYSPDASSPTRWLVVGLDGRVLARAETPPRFRLSQVGDDFVLGIARDELDVERVVMFSLSR